jgi:hypothetical protein
LLQELPKELQKDLPSTKILESKLEEEVAKIESEK